MKHYARRDALKLFGVGLASVAGLGLTGCNGADTSKEEEPKKTSGKKKKTSKASQSKPEDKLKSNVSVEDVSMTETQVYSASVDDYDPKRGYVIQATVTNGNDMSCDVTPYFAADVTATDDYGSDKTEHYVIYGSEVFTPYGREPASHMQSVGLAPNETKTVRYYVYLDGVDPIKAKSLTSKKAKEYKAGEPLILSLEDEDELKFYSQKLKSLANIELISFDVEEADRVYLPADAWSQNASLDMENDDGSSWGGYPTHKSSVTGSITNGTEDRWLTAQAQFDITLNGQAVDMSCLKGTYCSLDHVDTGASKELKTSTVTTAKNDYDVKLTPALLAYQPDEEN